MKLKRHHPHQRLLMLLMLLLLLVASLPFFQSSSSTASHSIESHRQHFNNSSNNQHPPPPLFQASKFKSETTTACPYHNWELFAADFEEMKQQLKIFVYSDAFNKSSPYANIFLPLDNPFAHTKLGNYFTEHMFKVALLRSSLLALLPEQADFFFLPFSINALRNDPRFHSEDSISQFVAHYTNTISHRFTYWNASAGADHFYVCCHSVGRLAPSRHSGLHNNAIQLTCSSSYFQRFFVSHKDVSLPQVWPRPPQQALNPPHSRDRLVYFAGRVQNSQARRNLINFWGNDSEMDIFHGSPSLPYEEGFKRSKYCLHVKGYEVNTARNYRVVKVLDSFYCVSPFGKKENEKAKVKAVLFKYWK